MRHDTNTFKEQRFIYEARSDLYPAPQEGQILQSSTNPVVTATATTILTEVQAPIDPYGCYSSPSNDSWQDFSRDPTEVDPMERIYEL